ncbi:ABC transporter permease [Alcanivorax sp. DP30]|uniref:PhnE/PtxC family ABC transporter permease n=1 Tax=Alcanivorax sp. DP30 TaxID=2606217 RepID=UPI00137067DF|nr:ABC transporter permease [Alcanivorax sp. DP30]MZR64089.1 ABC transporter permease [Alcanivorax sp. DP30]
MSPALNTTASGWRRASGALALVGLLAFAFADLSIARASPGQELMRMAQGFLAPDFFSTEFLWRAIANTLAFAWQGTALGALAGFLMAMCWQWRAVRAVAASVRAVHELFWGLLLLQLTGLSTVTAVLAIAIPYSGIFAKVFGEFLEEADPAPAAALPSRSSAISIFFYARLPLVWNAFKAYGGYRLECAIRASAILGFIGLPTLGFHLETAFREGHYDQGAALLYLFFLLIFTLRWWLRPALIPAYVLAAVAWAPPALHLKPEILIRFVTEDLVPAPLRQGGGLHELLQWLNVLWHQQLWPGLWQTLVLGMGALLVTALLSLLLFPLISPLFGNRLSRLGGHGLLVILRTTPEFFLAFFFLILLGPSMLPGILALALHTGAIVAHLTGRFSESLRLRDDAPTGLNRYAWEVLPRISPNLLAFLLYRWEVIMRETAVLGILGIHTLGFYIDSSVAEFRFDRTLILILATVMLNLLVDALSRGIRKRLRLKPGHGVM